MIECAQLIYLLNVTIDLALLLHHIQKILGSNLGPETDFLDLGFQWFSQPLQAYAGTVLQSMPRLLLSKSSPNYCLLIILSFDGMTASVV
jgi:hypothetical protein